MRKIPFSRQRTEYYCGPAIMQMVLAAYGIRATQRQLAEQAKTDKAFGRATGTETGTSISNLITTLKLYGAKVDAKNHRTIVEIKQALKSNKAVIVCFTERHLNWGHYALVIGFTGKYIKLLDPAEQGGAGEPMTIQGFKRRWNDPLHTKSIQWAAFVDVPPSPTKT